MYVTNIFTRIRLYVSTIYNNPRLQYVYNHMIATLFNIYVGIKQTYDKNKYCTVRI